ncbi:apolipoprotein N-acyltransferase [Rickettsiales bacterium]|nr:apolipoprotein N-acyltransferase [Rickettsiales bacterium]
MNRENIQLFFAGILSSFPFSFLPFPPLIIIGFYFLFKQLSSPLTKGDVLLKAFIFGFGYNIFGMHWIYFPLTFDERFVYFSILVPIIFSLFLSLFICLPSLVVYLFTKQSFLSKYFYLKSFLISFFFFISEFLKSKIFGGFPWNLFGHIWSFDENLIAISKYIGVFGISFLTVFWIVLVSQNILLKRFKRSAAVFFIFPAFFFLIGISSEKTEMQDSIKVRMVQPNISQEIKWSRDHMRDNMETIKKLSLENAESLDLIIWPEVAVPAFLNQSPKTIKYLSTLLPEETYLILGSLRVEKERIFNSLYLLSSKGVIDYYDKLKLVPFGEFIPFRNLLPLKKLTDGKRDFSEGLRRKIMYLNIKGRILKIEPSICYEGIFPEKKIIDEGSNILINITNDAWFGNTTGPYQHLTATKFRSVERGLPLIRVANSGISAIFDSNGKLMNSMPLNQEGYLDFNLKLSQENTVYSKYGNKLLAIILLIIFMIVIFLDIILLKKRLNS